MYANSKSLPFKKSLTLSLSHALALSHIYALTHSFPRSLSLSHTQTQSVHTDIKHAHNKKIKSYIRHIHTETKKKLIHTEKKTHIYNSRTVWAQAKAALCCRENEVWQNGWRQRRQQRLCVYHVFHMGCCWVLSECTVKGMRKKWKNTEYVVITIVIFRTKKKNRIFNSNFDKVELFQLYSIWPCHNPCWKRHRSHGGRFYFGSSYPTTFLSKFREYF